VPGESTLKNIRDSANQNKVIRPDYTGRRQLMSTPDDVDCRGLREGSIAPLMTKKNPAFHLVNISRWKAGDLSKNTLES